MSKGQHVQLGRVLAGTRPLTDEEVAALDGEDAALRIQLKRFFEAGSFYQPWPVPEARTPMGRLLGTDRLVIPAGFRIEMPCIQCEDSRRTFVLESKDSNNRYVDQVLPADEGPRLVRFKCTHCDRALLGYLVYVGKDGKTDALQIEKGGVYPSVRPQPSPELATGLGKAKAIFVKGLLNQNFGFGIGAFGYYRRVAEDIIGRLLDDLREHAQEAELTELVKIIDQSKKKHHAAEKIQLVLPLVPKILCPNGQNPLGTVFGALSEGLHGGTDQECLDEADSLRTALEFLIVKLESLVTTPKQYEEAMKKVQQANAKKAAPASKG